MKTNTIPPVYKFNTRCEVKSGPDFRTRTRSKRSVMDRRDFLITAGTLVAGATVSSGVPASGYAAETTSTAQGRKVLSINRNWRYSPTAAPAAHAREFDDSHFTRVTAPHTNLRVPLHTSYET